MKRRGILFVIGIWLLVIVGSGRMPVLAAEQGKPAELIVLVDTSLSLDEESINQEIQWMQKICSVSLGTEIQVNFLTFNEPRSGGEKTAKTLLKRTEITEANLESSLNAVSEISHAGAFTDLKGAVDEAIAILGGMDGSRRYIMILSDGLLDYDNNAEEDVHGTEARARKEFCEEVESFAGQQGCGVILVEFKGGSAGDAGDGDAAGGASDAGGADTAGDASDAGGADAAGDASDAGGADTAGDTSDVGGSNDESDLERFKREINLFHELKGKAGVLYFQGDRALSDAASSIFEKMGYPIESIASGSLKDRSIPFTLDQDYDYTIIHLMQKNSGDGEKRAIGEDDFRIWYKDEECRNKQIQLLSYSAFIFLDGSKAGNYTIDFSEGAKGEWSYEVICRKKERIDAIDLSLWQDDTKDGVEGGSEDDGEFYTGRITLHMVLEGDLDDMSNPLLYYCLSNENQDFGDNIPLGSPDLIGGQGRIRENTIFIEEAGEYQIQVFGSDGSVSSNLVSFTVHTREEEQETEPEEIEKKALVGDEINLRDMFGFTENEKVTICEEEGAEQNINEQMENDDYIIKDGGLTFKTARDCEMTIQGREKSYRVSWTVEDVDDDEGNCLQKIWNWICNFF